MPGHPELREPQVPDALRFGTEFSARRQRAPHAEPPVRLGPPALEYSSAGRLCTVIGGYVARDPHLPSLAGRYLYADFCGGSIRSFNPRAPGPSDAPTGLELFQPSSFGEARNGSLFVTSLDGPVYRIVHR